MDKIERSNEIYRHPLNRGYTVFIYSFTVKVYLRDECRENTFFAGAKLTGENIMKNTHQRVVYAIAMAIFLAAGVTGHAAVLTSTGNVQLDSAANWSPSQVPSSGNDSLSIGHALLIDSTWTIGSGQSMTWTANSWRFAEGGASDGCEQRYLNCRRHL